MTRYCEQHPLPYQADPGYYFERIHRQPGAVLLDSGRPVADRGRYDICSAWPVAKLQPQAEEPGAAFFARLRAALNTLGPAEFEPGIDLPFAGGLLGYLSYDFGRRLEILPDGPDDDLQLPDAALGLYDWALITDHALRTTQLVFHPACSGEKRLQVMSWMGVAPHKNIAAISAMPLPAATGHAQPGNPATILSADELVPFTLLGDFQPCTERDVYQQAIARILEYIRAGDCYQVNYTQRFQTQYQGNPWDAYRVLRKACATPFAGYINLGGDNAILSLSPERFVSVKQRRIEARPIKGTRPRGADAATDRLLAAQLCASTKDRAENLMIVDLLRNDIGRSSLTGSVRVPELFSLESYPNVHHLVSSIEAELAPGLDVFDLLAGSFPGGSITGAPKIRAMQIIDELEPRRRSLYCGSLLYIDVRGNMDSSITIRSLLAKDTQISCWAGGGIVLDSDWQEEHQESLDKVSVLLRTLESGRG